MSAHDEYIEAFKRGNNMNAESAGLSEAQLNNNRAMYLALRPEELVEHIIAQRIQLAGCQKQISRLGYVIRHVEARLARRKRKHGVLHRTFKPTKKPDHVGPFDPYPGVTDPTGGAPKDEHDRY